MRIFAILGLIAFAPPAHAEMQLLVKLKDGRACSAVAFGLDGSKVKIRPVSDQSNEYQYCASALPQWVTTDVSSPLSRSSSIRYRSTEFSLGDRVLISLPNATGCAAKITDITLYEYVKVEAEKGQAKNCTDGLRGWLSLMFVEKSR